MKKQQQNRNWIYIAGYGRSGTTILDRILGSHKQIQATGELAHFSKVFSGELIEKCGCGETSVNCRFWNEINSELTAIGDNGDVHRRMKSLSEQLERFHIYNFFIDGKTIAQSKEEFYRAFHSGLFEQIKKQADGKKDFIVDSSKSTFEFGNRPFCLNKLCGHNVYLLHIVRRGEAVIWSNIKAYTRQKGKKPSFAKELIIAVKTAFGWNIANFLALYQSGRLNPRKYFLIKYEELIVNLRENLQNIYDWLGLEKDGFPFVTNTLPTQHQIAGNQLRHKENIEIVLDDDWKNKLHKFHRIIFCILGLPFRILTKFYEKQNLRHPLSAEHRTTYTMAKSPRIKYIVNIDLLAKTARSRQTYSTGRAFHNLLGNNFQLVVAGGNSDKFIKKRTVAGIKSESSKLRKALFLCQAFFDIVFASNGTIIFSRNLFILALAALLKKPIVWEMHDKISGANLKLFLWLKEKLRIVVISQALHDYLVENYDLDSDKIHLAPDAVLLKDYDKLRHKSREELRTELGLSLDKQIIMHTGSLYKGRGAELFEVILSGFPELLFVQVGGTDEDVNKWRQYYRNYKNICFVPHQNNSSLIKYQMSADLLFLPMTKSAPTWWCTSPMKLFEYMAAGIPIFASNVGSVGEVLSKNNAIIFDPENKDTIVEGVKYFLNNPGTSLGLAKKALKDVREKYTWEKRVCGIGQFLGLI